ncbi:hypothetical protein JCM10450v2_000807 [Rhodotorula kratochvilovae]
MVMQALQGRTSRLHGRRLAHLFETGTLRDVVNELASPTWPSTPPLPPTPTQGALSVLDSSAEDGTVLLAAAATAPNRTAAFRLACFSLLLNKGASPFARGEDGRSVEAVLRYTDDEVARWCLTELEYAQGRARRGERYEMPEEIAERIRLELNVLDGKVPVPPLEQDDAAMQDAAPAAPVRPAAKRPRATSPLPDYEDDEPPAKREPEQSAIEMFRAATEQQKRDAEAAAAAAYAAVRASVATAAPVVLAAPKPQPNRASTLPGLSEHESYVFMPLVQTLRAMHADGQPESLCSQAGSELRARFPDVYARDGNYAKWKTYVSRAEELGIVTLSQGRKQGGEAIRLNWQYLKQQQPPPAQPQPMRQPPTAAPHARPDTAAPLPRLNNAAPPPRPDTAVPPPTASRRPPPPPPPPPYIPPEAVAPPPSAPAAPAAAGPDPSTRGTPLQALKASSIVIHREPPASKALPKPLSPAKAPASPAKEPPTAPVGMRAGETALPQRPPSLPQKPRVSSVSRLPPSVTGSSSAYAAPARAPQSPAAPAASTAGPSGPPASAPRAPSPAPSAASQVSAGTSTSAAPRVGTSRARLPAALQHPATAQSPNAPTRPPAAGPPAPAPPPQRATSAEHAAAAPPPPVAQAARPPPAAPPTPQARATSPLRTAAPVQAGSGPTQLFRAVSPPAPPLPQPAPAPAPASSAVPSPQSPRASAVSQSQPPQSQASPRQVSLPAGSPAPSSSAMPSPSPAPSTGAFSSTPRLPSGSPAPSFGAFSVLGAQGKPRKSRLPLHLLERGGTSTPAPPLPVRAGGPLAPPLPARAGGPLAPPLPSAAGGPFAPPVPSRGSGAGAAGPAAGAGPSSMPPAPAAGSPAPTIPPAPAAAPLARPFSRLPQLVRPPPTPVPLPPQRSPSVASPATPTTAFPAPKASSASPAAATPPPPPASAAPAVPIAAAPAAAPVLAAPTAGQPRGPRSADYATMELHRLPPYATPLVLRKWLLSGPGTFAHVAAADLSRLADVSPAPPPPPLPAAGGTADVVPPIVRRVELVPGREGCARVVYTSRENAERARAMFNGRRVVEGPAGAGETGVVWLETEGGGGVPGGAQRRQGL